MRQSRWLYAEEERCESPLEVEVAGALAKKKGSGVEYAFREEQESGAMSRHF